MTTITFDRPGTFEALNALETLLRTAGFSVGSGCFDAPACVLFGRYTIAKWKNLTLAERATAHATITGDRRNGPVTLTIFDACPEEGLTAIATAMAQLKLEFAPCASA
jgi:hypothetical protein